MFLVFKMHFENGSSLSLVSSMLLNQFGIGGILGNEILFLDDKEKTDFVLV